MSRRYTEPPAVVQHDAVQSQFLTPFQRKMLLKSLQAETRPEYRRRIEIMLLADGGQSQTEVCHVLGCSQETARYWIKMLQTGQAHTWNDNPIGRPKTVSDRYLNRLKELATNSPREFGYPFQSWTAQWLSKHLAKEFCIEISDRHINRLLKGMGLSTQQKRAQSVPSSSVSPAAPPSRIEIGNLQGVATADLPELWQFKPV